MTRLRLLKVVLGCAVVVGPQINAQQRESAETMPLRAAGVLKTGVLKNGMTYYIQSNPSPAKRAAMWLVVNAGSIHEDEDQLGYAHLMEHMAFNGTRKFPGNKLIDVVEQAGLSFGADLNAYTSFDETVYMLTVPTDDSTMVQNGLGVLYDWASGGVLIDSAEVARERGVVLGEWRQRLADTMALRLFNDQLSRSFGGDNKYMHRMPIGTPESIEGATVVPLRRFYRDWYRPDLMAVIVVGDFEIERMYQEIQRSFGSISTATIRRPFTRPAVTPEARTAVHVVRDYLQPKVTVRWPDPIHGTTSEEQMTRELIWSILTRHLNEIYGRLSDGERRPFGWAALRVEAGGLRPLGRGLELALSAHPDSLENALAYALGEVERVARLGLSVEDFALAKSLEERRLVQAADRSGHIQSGDLAKRYVEHFFGSGDLLMTPEQRLAIGTRVLAHLTNADIQRAAAFWKEWVKRSVSVEIPLFASVRTPTEAEVRAWFDVTRAQRHVETVMPLTVMNAQSIGRNASSDTHATFSVSTGSGVDGRRDAVVSETMDRASGVFVWTLRNGARVVFKHTMNNPDEVIVHAISPGGYSKLPDSLRLSSGRMIADLMTASGSTEHEDPVRFRQQLRILGVTRFEVILSGLREGMLVSGSSRNPEILFSTMYRQFVDPYIDSTAFEAWKRTGSKSVTYSKEDKFLFQLTGDRRFGPPPVPGVALMNLEKGLAVFKDRFGDASDFTFYVVGAISADSAKAFASRYLAQLPSSNRRAPEALIQTSVNRIKGHWAGSIENRYLKAVQAFASLQFGGYLPKRYDSLLTEEQRLQAVTQVLGQRLRNKLREEMSVTYGAGAALSIIPVPDWYYMVGIQFMASPEDIQRSVDSTWQVIRTLQREGPTREELAMTAKIYQRRHENLQQSNAWWIMELYRYDFMGAPFSMLANTGGPTPLDASVFKRTMRRYLSEEAYTQQIAIPTKRTIEKGHEQRVKQGNEAKLTGGTHFFYDNNTAAKSSVR